MGVMRQKFYQFLASLGSRLWLGQTLSPSRVILVVGLLLVALLLPLPALILDGFVATSWLLSGLCLAAAVWAGEPQKLPQLPTLLLLSLLGRLCLTLALMRLGLSDGQLGGVPLLFQSLVGGREVGVDVLLLVSLLLAEYVLIARGGERVAEVAARFVLDALPGRQAAIDADLRAGSLGAVEAQTARATLTREAELYGSLDGVMRLLRGDVLLSVLLWLGLFVALLAKFSTGDDLPLTEGAERSAALTVAVGLCTQVPVLLVSTAAVLLQLRSTSSRHSTDERQTTAPLQLVTASDVALSAVQAQAIVHQTLAQLGLLPCDCSLRADPALRRQLRLSIHGALLSQHTLTDGETPQNALTKLLHELAPELLTLDGLRAELSSLGHARPALLSEVIPKRLSLGRLLLVLRRLLAERVWPLPMAAVLETLATLPEIDGDADALVDQIRAGLGRHLLSGYLPQSPSAESGDALPALVLSSDVEEVLRDARRSSGGQRLAIEPELRQEIIDAVLLAKSHAPDAVLLCQRDIRRQVELLLSATPHALPVLAFSELPPQLPLRVVSRIGPGSP